MSLSKFPDQLKREDILPAQKKSKLSKENCKPIRILSNISVIYERCLYNQIATYSEKVFSKYQCRFRKGYSAQYYCTSCQIKIKELKVNDVYSSWKYIICCSSRINTWSFII